LIAADEIHQSFSKPIQILFSGGLDSEVVVRSFVEAGITPEIYIIEFEDELNKHDIDYAKRACQSMGLSFNTLKLNLFNFWQGPVWDYARPVGVCSPQLAVILWAVNQLDGTVVLGAGDGYFRRDEGSNIFYDYESEISYSLYRWFVYKQKESVPAFFQYSSELMLSFCLDSKVLRFLRDGKSRGLLSSQRIKHELYSQHFELEFRVPQNGFEKVQVQDKNLRDEMLKSFPGSDQIYRVNAYRYIQSFGGDLPMDFDSYFVNFQNLQKP